MTNLRILIMRHAEKTGALDDLHLSEAGARRAVMLADYIPATFGTPDVLIATAISKRSGRPIETITPLSQKIDLPIETSFANQDYGTLAAELSTNPRFENRLVLVCWHHGKIANLMRALYAPPGTYPDPWGDDVYNLILQYVRTDGGEPQVTTHVQPV